MHQWLVALLFLCGCSLDRNPSAPLSRRGGASDPGHGADGGGGGSVGGGTVGGGGASPAPATDGGGVGGDAGGSDAGGSDGGNDGGATACLPSGGGVETCDGVDNDCNGSVDDGFAQLQCLQPNTFGSCMAGRCVVVLCDSGYADCDALAANGCETLLDPVPGDCQVSQCGGATVEDNGDVPASDGNDCTTELCDEGAPLHEPVEDGTSCGSGNQQCASGVCT